MLKILKTKDLILLTQLLKLPLNAKINEVKGKIPSTTNLAKTTLNAVENKIPSVSNLVKKLTITQKLMELERNLLIIVMIDILLSPEFNKFTKENFDFRYKQK